MRSEPGSSLFGQRRIFVSHSQVPLLTKQLLRLIGALATSGFVSRAVNTDTLLALESRYLT